jgi:hypothetical protein
VLLPIFTPTPKIPPVWLHNPPIRLLFLCSKFFALHRSLPPTFTTTDHPAALLTPPLLSAIIPFKPAKSPHSSLNTNQKPPKIPALPRSQTTTLCNQWKIGQYAPKDKPPAMRQGVLSYRLIVLRIDSLAELTCSRSNQESSVGEDVADSKVG